MSGSDSTQKGLHTPRRRRLLLSSAALLGALSGYGRSAYGQVAGGLCTDTIASGVVTCTGSSTAAQSINQNVGSATGGLAVSVTPAPLQVDTAAGNALTITGYGAVSFIDSYGASYLDSRDAGGSTALAITSTGTATPGSVTVETSGTVSGDNRGINAVNDGDGATSITIAGNGKVTSGGDPTDRAINVRNGTPFVPAGTTLTVTTGAGTEVTGAIGIAAANYGSGVLTVEANGEVTGTEVGAGRGIATYNYNSAGTTVTTGAGSVIEGDLNGIDVNDNGSGTAAIEANGTVLGNTAAGIIAVKEGGSLNITTNAGSTVRGSDLGIRARAETGASAEIAVNGDVTVTSAAGRGVVVSVTSNGLSAKVTTGAGSTVSGGYNGIIADNVGSGGLTVEANGTVTSDSRTGIAVENRIGGRIAVTTGAGSTVTGGQQGIYARERGGETLTIETNGTVTGGTDDGLFARHAGGAINITIGAASTVTSNGVNADDFAIETLGGTSDVTVAGTLNNGGGGGVQFDPGNFNDRLELHPTAEINGTVLAGLGTDTLAFGGAGDGAFDLGAIDDGGGGGLQYQSFETFEVDSGTWTFSGGTAADFTVNGGTVMGTGTFGDLTLNGGTIAPGNSIGTMTVNGAFTLGAGAVFEVEANAAGEADKVIVNGTVNLTGATLRVLAETGFYALRTNYVIIENDGTDPVVGTFSNITSSLAFLIPTVIYDGGTGNDVVLTLKRDDGALVEVAVTENQTSVAKVFVNCNIEDPLCVAVLTQTATGARQAFNTLSGEIHATVAGTLSDDSRYVREAVLGRLMQASHMGEALSAGGPQVFDGKSLVPLAPERAPLAFWTEGYGAWGDFDSDGNAASADRDLGGFISGMDAGIGEAFGGSWRAGLATGASFSSVDVSGRYSSADVSTYHLGGYIGGMAGAFALRGGGMWGWSDIETSRAVVFPNFYERQKANYDADTGQIFGEIAYPTQMGGIALEPFGGLAFVSVDTDNFTERGGPEASLRGRNLDQDVGYTTLGLRAATTTMWGGTQVTPHISAAWLHAFDDVTPDAALAFASTGIGFVIDGVPLAEDSALLDAGLDFAVSDRLSAGVSYTGQFGDGVTDNGIRGRFTWLFN